ncbi:MAG: 9-O-acetylesterase [Gemmatimonadetes bacterium]|nr:9-O-acetylesterase [Gemmatimonadota bacterium]NNM06408.1 9-O-acetylesterase [Gemmatimonadota bacterium]
MTRHTKFFLFLLVATTACSAPAEIRPSALFSDGVVLQRDAEIHVWGTARPGARVEVALGDGEAVFTTDADGHWSVSFPAMEAGGPHELVITGSGYEGRIRDVMIGDVWVASGQSNMEWPVSASADAEAEIASANDRLIRHFKVPHVWAESPVDTVVGGPWTYAVPEQVGSFSAVAYYFAHELREHVDVPIGILNTSWGGSRIEPWMTPEALGYDQAQVQAVFDAEREVVEEALAAIRERVGSVPLEDEGLVDGQAVWAEPDLDESDWTSIAVPSPWETQGFQGIDGVAWYRASFDLTADEAASGALLGLGQIDDSDRTWVNGSEITGPVEAWNVPREYPAEPSQLREGRNVISIRVEDTGGNGGIVGSPDQLFVQVGSERRPLADSWAFRLGEVRVPGTPKNRVPLVLYNAMIHPLLPFPIKGAIWYQGESNANAESAFVYRDLFPSMIEDWRGRWGVGDFPFLWVQLANYMAPDPQPVESAWAMLRESQSATLSVENTGQAVIIDIGEADDIHPRNKQDVGLRLSLAARHLAFGEDILYSGPTYSSHSVAGGQITIEFDHTGQGLTGRAVDGTLGSGVPLGGFAVAGADGTYRWADARIEGSTVVVSSPDVPSPVAVRYAWGNNPDRANLYNVDGLPASPFRTDSW